ncbi:MAG: hypothetical protein GX594_00095 [Pirellulaceae bacterium]|nr:hypothetical protein [Pirellulaceae bacterium]
MQSSITTAFRALTMLVCLVGITAAATHGSSWSAVVEKFKNLELPSVLHLASASQTAESDKPDRLATIASPPPFGMAETPVNRSVQDEPIASQTPQESPISAGQGVAQPPEPNGYQEVQNRLQLLGATYYLLESWGNNQELYRFQCQVAVDGNGSYTRYFEATDSDPLRAMLLVLREVEDWHEG